MERPIYDIKSLREQEVLLNGFSLSSVASQLEENPYSYSRQELRQFAYQASDLLVTACPITQSAVAKGASSNQLKKHLSILIEEKLRTYQPDLRSQHQTPVDINTELSQAFTENQQHIIKVFAESTKDHQRVILSCNELVITIPDASKVSELVKIVNAMIEDKD